jgi:hypothetical protein
MELKMNSSWLRRRKLRHLRSASISTIANEATPLAVNPTRNDTTDMEIPRNPKTQTTEDRRTAGRIRDDE